MTNHTRTTLDSFLAKTAFDTDVVYLHPVLIRHPSSTATDEQAEAMFNRACNQARVWVTPAVAERWLKYNLGNRAKNWDHIKTLARDMKNGDFVDLGDLAHFGVSATGSPLLLNVQHRLEAIIMSGVAQPLTISWGHSLDDRMFMDLGTKRGLATMFNFMGKPYPMYTAKTARVLVNVLDGKNTHTTLTPSEGSNSRSLRTFTEAMNDRPEFYEAVQRYTPLYSQLKMDERRFAAGAMLHEAALMYAIDPKTTDYLFDGMIKVKNDYDSPFWYINKAAKRVYKINTQTTGDSKHCTIGQTRGLMRAAWNDLKEGVVRPENYDVTALEVGPKKTFWRPVAPTLVGEATV